MNTTIDNQQEINKVRDVEGRFIKGYRYKFPNQHHKLIEKSGLFQFQNLNKQLSYLLGVYLSDGYVMKEEQQNNYRRFGLECIDKDFAEKTQNCINYLTGEKKTIRERISSKEPKRIYYRATSSNQNLCFWLEEETGLKTKIPTRIFESPIELKKEFLAGLLDGDGWVTKQTNKNAVSIGFAIKDNWIWQVRFLLQKIGVETSDIKIMNKKNPVYFFIIRSKSFIKNKLYFSIKRKQERINNFIYSSETKRVFPLKEMI